MTEGYILVGGSCSSSGYLGCRLMPDLRFSFGKTQDSCSRQSWRAGFRYAQACSCQALAFLGQVNQEFTCYQISSCTLSLELPWWHLTPTKRTFLDKAEFWTLALGSE